MGISLIEGDGYTVNDYFPAKILLEEGTYFVEYNGFKKPILSTAGSHNGTIAALWVSRRVKVVITPAPISKEAPP